MLAPRRSLWMMSADSAFRSSTPLRSPSARSASSRVRPLRSSMRDLGELLAEGVVTVERSSPTLRDGGVQAEAGLEADDHQVEAVRQRAGDLPHAVPACGA